MLPVSPKSHQWTVDDRLLYASVLHIRFILSLLSHWLAVQSVSYEALKS